MTKTAVYPGSFDPVTYGHIDLIKRAAKIFKRVIVAVADNSAKDSFFTVEERITLIKQVTKGLKNVEVDSFKGLSIDYVRSRHSYVIIRGVRMISDFEYEFQMALTNRHLNENVETIFLMPNEAYSYLSSRLIKETACLGADISCFVPKVVASAVKRKLSKRNR